MKSYIHIMISLANKSNVLLKSAQCASYGPSFNKWLG